MTGAASAPRDGGRRADGASPPRKPTIERERRIARSAADREFLPAVLEILETPPSPIGTWLASAICILFALALAWSWFGRLDIVAVAPGRIQPTGRVKVVQPAEPGRVEEIFVRNGSDVAVGAPLLALDPRDARADVAASAAALASLSAEAIRRRTALAAVGGGGTDADPIVWPNDVPLGMRDRETLVLRADLARLAAELGAADAERTQKEAEVRRLQATIAAQHALLATQNIRVGMRSELLERSAGSKAQLIDAEETRQTQLVNLATQEGQLTEAVAALEVIARNRRRAIDGFTADYGQKLADAERQIDDLRERLIKARTRLERMTVRAPIAGTVTAMTVHGLGRVVGAGEEVLRIVPEGSRLELEVHMPNTDIGFVRVGQPVVVKIDSFPYSRFGGVTGKVVRIAGDAVSDAEVQQSLTSPASAPKSMGSGGTQRVQGLVYPITIELERQSISIEGSDVPLAAGMTAEAEIKTGSRRILEYVFSPLVDVGSRALKER